MDASKPPEMPCPGSPAKRGIGRRAALSGALALGISGRALALGVPGGAPPAGWDEILRDGAGQEVFFHAWGGDDRTNAFIAWAGGRMLARHHITLRHVKLRDTREAVAQVAAERAAGWMQGGSVDLVWIAGSNLAAMRDTGLLDTPVLDLLPAARRVDPVALPMTVTDRAVKLSGCVVPWRLAQIVFIYSSGRSPDPPQSISALLDWALRHPGRLSHLPADTELGTAFLEQALHELVPDPGLLQHPVTDKRFAEAASPLWAWYDRLRPALWQSGKVFPASFAEQADLMNRGKIDLMISLHPSAAVIGIATGTLSADARTYVPEHGSLGHCSFLGVPFNAAHRAGTLLVANFLLSPEAQARASDPRFVGAPTVLALDRLSAEDYVFFDAVPRSPDLLSDAERGAPLPEPHVSWTDRIVAGWTQRIAS